MPKTKKKAKNTPEYEEPELLKGFEEIFSKSNKTKTDIDNSFKDIEKWVKTTVNKKENKLFNREIVLNNFQEFVNRYFSHYTIDSKGNNIPLAQFHLDYANEFINNIQSVSVTELPRGFAKTTVTMFLLAFMIIKKQTRCAIYISKNKEFSAEQMHTLRCEFMYNERLIDDFGPFETQGQDSYSIVGPNADCMIYAMGIGQSPRGLRHRNNRVDTIISDDSDSNELSRNKKRVRLLYDYFTSELMQCVDLAKPWRISLIGNRFSDNTLLNFVSKMPKVKHTVIKAMVPDADGVFHSSWPGRFTDDMLNDMKSRISNNIWKREYMNEPVEDSGGVLNVDLLKWGNVNFSEVTRCIMYLDSSYTEGSGSDFKSVVILMQINGERYFVYDIFCKQCSLTKCAEWIYNKWAELKTHGISCTCFYEANFIQGRFISNEFREMEKVKGFFISSVPDITRKSNKATTIEGLVPYLEKGLITINENIRESLDVKEALSQLSAFEINGNAHDDFPDSLINSILKCPLRRSNSSSDMMIMQYDNKWRY